MSNLDQEGLAGVSVLALPVDIDGKIPPEMASLHKSLPPGWHASYRDVCDLGILEVGGIDVWSSTSSSESLRYVVSLPVNLGPASDSDKVAWITSVVELRTWAEKNGIDEIMVSSLDPLQKWTLDEAFAHSKVSVLHRDFTKMISSEKGRVDVPLAVSPSQPVLLAEVNPYPGFTSRVVHGRTVYEIPGLTLIPNLLTKEDADLLTSEISSASKEMPFVRPVMPNSGTPFKYDMACFGPKIWISDKAGYRYEDNLLSAGTPAYVPNAVNDAAGLALHAAGLDYGERPQMQTFLVNDYKGPQASLGMHRDKDEPNKRAPIASISLGAAGIFAFKDPATGVVHRIRLEHGMGVVMHGTGRLAMHAVEKIDGERRINITARQVLNERIDVPKRGPRLPSALAVIAARHAVPSPTPASSPELTGIPVIIEIDNAAAYRSNKAKLDVKSSFYVGRVSWPGEELGVARYWGLRNQFKVPPGQPNGVAIEPFERSLLASLLKDDAALQSIAREYPEFNPASAPEIARDFYRIVDLAEKDGKMTLLCHCHPKPCHSGVVALYMAAELQRRGRPATLFEASVTRISDPLQRQSVGETMANLAARTLEVRNVLDHGLNRQSSRSR